MFIHCDDTFRPVLIDDFVEWCHLQKEQQQQDQQSFNSSQPAQQYYYQQQPSQGKMYYG